MQQQTYMLPEGLTLSEVVRPATVEEVGEVLRGSSKRDTPVIPVGGGTSLETGNHVAAPFLGIDLRGLTGVRQYEPEDLTASFWAGTSVGEVSATLADQGQELPLDLSTDDQGTIGGLVATGFSGPRRLGSGSIKDLLIGCGYVRGDGLIAKAGGMLVKNVSGFEIPRLLHGSWGSLAVLTSINLKVVPKPKADVTVSQYYDALDDAMAAQISVMQRHAVVYASVIEKQGDSWGLHIRLLGRYASLRAQVQSLLDDLGADARVAEDSAFWNELNRRWLPDSREVRVTLGGRPSAIKGLARAASSWPGLQHMAISIPTGSVRVSIIPKSLSISELNGHLRSVRHIDAATWTIDSAPVYWKQDNSVWGPERPETRLMTAIKREFDPAGILNRGRLFI